MSGIAAAIMGSGAGGGSSGTPGTIAWSNAYGVGGASTNTQTLSGITGALTISATATGIGALYYTLNGVGPTYYAGPFAWPEGQALSWTLLPDGGNASGTVTVINAVTSATLASFAYSVKSPSGPGYL